MRPSAGRFAIGGATAGSEAGGRVSNSRFVRHLREEAAHHRQGGRLSSGYKSCAVAFAAFVLLWLVLITIPVRPTRFGFPFASLHFYYHPSLPPTFNHPLLDLSWTRESWLPWWRFVELSCRNGFVAHLYSIPTLCNAAVLLGIAGAIALVTPRSRKHTDPAHPRCAHCGYDLYGAPSNRCPECGNTVDARRAINSIRLPFGTVVWSVVVAHAVAWALSAPDGFAVRFSHLNSWMDRADVLALLGEPDVRTPAPPDPEAAMSAFERLVWRYVPHFPRGTPTGEIWRYERRAGGMLGIGANVATYTLEIIPDENRAWRFCPPRHRVGHEVTTYYVLLTVLAPIILIVLSLRHPARKSY